MASIRTLLNFANCLSLFLGMQLAFSAPPSEDEKETQFVDIRSDPFEMEDVSDLSPTEKSESIFEKLPDEICGKIFSFLSIHDFPQVILINQHFKAIAIDPASLKRTTRLSWFKHLAKMSMTATGYGLTFVAESIFYATVPLRKELPAFVSYHFFGQFLHGGSDEAAEEMFVDRVGLSCCLLAFNQYLNPYLLKGAEYCHAVRQQLDKSNISPSLNKK